MKYVAERSNLVVDLRRPERERWLPLLKDLAAPATYLAKEAKKDLIGAGVSTVLLSNLVRGFGAAYRASGGLYVDEMKPWADALGMTVNEVIALNCSYEIAHASGLVLGCTAGVGHVEGLGMVHVRNLDWPLRNIGRATRVFEFTDGERSFFSVGMAGFVGVLSGMVPGGYSVTINWATPDEGPGFDLGPSFLLRKVLETCDSYHAAVDALRKAPLATSVYYVVCGIGKGEGCVIERTRADAVVRRIGVRDVLVQANHYQSKKFLSLNEDLTDAEEDEISLLDDSRERQLMLEERLRRFLKDKKPWRPSTYLDVLNTSPLRNEDTHQQMVFCPAAGELRVRRSS